MPSWYPASVVVRSRFTEPRGPIRPPHANAGLAIPRIAMVRIEVRPSRRFMGFPPGSRTGLRRPRPGLGSPCTGGPRPNRSVASRTIGTPRHPAVKRRQSAGVSISKGWVGRRRAVVPPGLSPETPHAHGRTPRGVRPARLEVDAGRAKRVHPKGQCSGPRRKAKMSGMTTDALTLDDRQAVGWKPFLVALGIGIAFDVAALYQLPGISIPLFFVLVVGILRRRMRRSTQDDMLLASAVVFSSFCAVRASQPLLALDVTTSVAIVGIVATSNPRSALRAGILDALRVLERLVIAAFGVPWFVLRPFVRSWQRAELGRAKPVIRVVAIAVPVLAIFAGLLASADRVFGRLIVPRLAALNVSSAARHVGFS